MAIRKTAEQIKDEILSNLNSRLLSIEQIRKKIDSNWSTTYNYLEELKKDGKVKEIISADKAKIYQRVFGDTYFDIPISDEERKKFRALFSLIIQEYKSQGKIPTKTCFAKCAVFVIKNEDSLLTELPTVWYLYGMIPLMIADPSIEYLEEIKLKHKAKIKNLISQFIIKTENKGTRQIETEQHKEYGEELYVLADNFFRALNKCEWKNDEILRILNEFFIAAPIDSEFPEIFDLTEKFISIIDKLGLLGVKLQEYRKEILLTFDSLWRYIALYKLFMSKTSGKNAIGKENLLKFFIGGSLEEKKTALKENIAELNSVYLSHLASFDMSKLKIPDKIKEIRKIMEGWTGAD